MEQPVLHLSYEGLPPYAADTGACAPWWLRNAVRSASMNDHSPAFNPVDTRARRRVVHVAVPRASARAPGALRPGALAVQAAASHAQACARGEFACRAAWMRVQALGATGILALPRATTAAHVAPVQDAAAIASEADAALAHGVRPGSARALVLLAALAEARFDGGADALAVAAAAVTLAQEGQEAASVQRLHAALVQARHAPFAACLAVHGDVQPDLENALLCAGMRLAAGAPLARQIHALEQAPGLATPLEAGELAARLALLHALALAPSDATAAAPQQLAAGGTFGTQVARLQLAYYSGMRSEAGSAAAAAVAAALGTALAAPADLLCYHLFAMLALAWDAAPQQHHAARWHRAALDAAAARCPENAGAMAALAGAVDLAGAGDVAGGLRGYEAAAALAAAHGQTWLAALGWELAAALCQQAGFQAALPAYRRRALMAWHGCGAHGRVAQLCRGWNRDSASSEGVPGAAAGWPCAQERREDPGYPSSQDSQDEMRRVARAGTVGELGVSIAHEVNQPLAAILLQAAAARRWLRRPRPDLDKALDALEQIAVSGRRAGDIVRSVQGLARRHATGLTVFPVDAALDEALRLLSRSLRKHGVRAELALDLAGCQLHANRPQLQQVVINLLLNAIDALAVVEGRERHIVLASRRLEAGTIEISVADNGPGVAPRDRAQIFDALFSTKPNGTGVGLSISRAIAEAHGGHIAFRPRSPHGALFALVLPADACGGADA